MLQIYKKKNFHLQKPLFFHLINATGHKKSDRERLKRRFLSQNLSFLRFFLLRHLKGDEWYDVTFFRLLIILGRLVGREEILERESAGMGLV